MDKYKASSPEDEDEFQIITPRASFHGSPKPPSSRLSTTTLVEELPSIFDPLMDENVDNFRVRTSPFIRLFNLSF